MFTFNIRNIVAGGKRGVKWDGGKLNSAPSTEAISYSNFIKLKSLEAQKKMIDSASLDQRREILTKIDTLNARDGGSKANHEWRQTIIDYTQLKNFEEKNAKEALAPAAPTTLAPAPLVAANPGVAQNQIKESVTAVTARAEKVADVKVETVENIDGLKVDMVMTKLFQLDSDFFKGEITRVEKFQELITVVASCLKSGASPKTEEEWVKLGYSGQNKFEWGDADELAVVNAFLENVKKNPKNAKLVQYIATHAGNNEAAYKTVLNDLNRKSLSTMAGKQESEALKVGKDGKIEKSISDSRIDALLGNDTLWSGLANRDDIKASIMRASGNGKSLDTLYKRITGQNSSPDWTDDRAILSASVDFRDALNARLAIMKAIGGGNAGLDSVLQGKDTEFAKKIQDYIKKNGEIQVEALDKNISPILINSLTGILGVAVALGTSGIITLRAYSVEDMKADEFLDKLNKDPKIEGADKSLLEWIGNLFVGRKFKLAIGNVDSHDAMKERLFTMARKIQGITKDTKPESISDLGLRTGFIEAQKIGLLNSPEGVKAFQQYLLEQAIISDALSEKDNTRWSASLNPLFLGIHRDGTSVDQFGSKTSQGNKLEAQNTAKQVPLSSLGIKASADGKKFDIPQSMKDVDGVFAGDIPVVIQNIDGTLEAVTEKGANKSFDKSQSITAALITNNSAPLFVVSFSEASNNTPATSATVKNNPISVNDTLMTAAAESARASLSGNFIDNITIRTKFAGLQKSISAISSEKDVNTVFASLEKSPQLKTIFIENKDKSVSEKYSVLLSILGEFAGDQRYRKLRLYQKNPDLLDKKNEIAYLRPILHTIIGGTAGAVSKMSDAQIKEKIANLTMGDITRVTIAPENEKFENTEMEKLGLNGVDTIRNQYREADKGNKIYTEKTRTAEGFGFMMNHQVLGKKVTFAGTSALAPEMQIRDIDPIDVTGNMDKAKFINRLNTLQVARITAAVNNEYPGVNYTNEQIKSHLNGTDVIASLAVQAKFYYAQFPNCTNDVLFMKIDGPRGELNIDMKGVFGTSTVIDTPVARTNKSDGGVNPAAVLLNARKNDEPKTPDQPKTPENNANTTTGSGNANGPANGIITDGSTVTPPIKDVAPVLPTPTLPTPIIVPGR